MSSLLHSHWQQSLAGTQARLTPAIRTTAKVRAREDPESLQRVASWLPNYRCNCRILPFPFFLVFLIFSIQSEWTLDVSQVCFWLQRATQTLQLAQLVGLWINASSGTILLQAQLGYKDSDAEAGPKRPTPKAARTVEANSLTPGSHSKPERSTTGGALRSFSKFRWVDLCMDSASCWASIIPGLACLTNMVLTPKTFTLLPHVKKNRKLRGFSTASMRSGQDNQEKRGLKWLFWSMWKIDILCAC